MKFGAAILVVVLFALSALAAERVEVLTLPPSLFADTEVSTNTVLEHIFYSGTTNGVFAYPQPSAEVAVLKVMVSGSGTGRLVVGDDVVPLVGFSTGLTRLTGLRGGANPDNPVNPVTNTLLLAVGRGVRKEVWFDKPDGLDVALDSDDFNLNSTDEEEGIPRPNGWPTRTLGWLFTTTWTDEWLHSDMKDVSYFYTYKFFEKVIEEGDLQ